MLFLVATPIGNLKDITLRAIETLNAADYILCEDTRHSKILLDEYNVKKPLKSFHQFNEKQLEDQVVHDLKLGKQICLISDAGTPGICDPGERLIRRCYKENLPFTALPGPCAWAVALSLCPHPKENVVFLGFFTKKAEERKRVLAKALSSSSTVIFYESPHRLVESLQTIPPDAKVVVARELTKKFEEHLLKSAQEMVDHFQRHPPQGEFVVMIEGTLQDHSHLSPQDHVAYLQKTFNLSKNDAIKIAAELRHAPKREIYQATHQQEENHETHD